MLKNNITAGVKASEGLIDRPNNVEKLKLVKEILGAHEYFKKGQLNDVRRKLHWIDNVMYEDLRDLHIQNKFDADNIVNVLN